jgi:hypothetical protein
VAIRVPLKRKDADDNEEKVVQLTNRALAYDNLPGSFDNDL